MLQRSTFSSDSNCRTQMHMGAALLEGRHAAVGMTLLL